MAVPFVSLALAAALAAQLADSAAIAPAADSARAAVAARPDSVRTDSARADAARSLPPGTTPISARYLPPAGAMYLTEEVRVRTAEHYSLAGTLVLPWRAVPNRQRFPVVVMVTDGGPHNRDHTPAESLGVDAAVSYRPFAEIADTLARLGIASLRLDDRGVGSSTGTPANADALDLTYDQRAALQYLRRRPEIDPMRMIVLGLGEGALCAGMLGRFETDLAGLVLMSSPADPGRAVVAWRAQRRVTREGVPSIAEWEKLVTTDRAARFLDTYDPLGTARVLRCPVLLLEGGAGEEAPPRSAARLAEAMRDARNADVTVREYPGLTHRLLPAEGGEGGQRLPRRVLGDIADWVQQRILQRRSAPAPPASRNP